MGEMAVRKMPRLLRCGFVFQPRQVDQGIFLTFSTHLRRGLQVLANRGPLRLAKEAAAIVHG